MIRKLSAVFLTACIALTLVGCSGGPAADAPSTVPGASTSAESPTPNVEPAATESALSSDAPSSLTVPLTAHTVTSTDSRGYTQTATVRVSPMMRASDTSEIEEAWQSVGGSGSVPCANGIAQNTQAGGNDAVFSPDTMALAVGTMTITNDTPEFNASNFNQGNGWGWFSLTTIEFGQAVRCAKAGSSSAAIRSNWTSDTWGPTPFVLAVDQVFTPNTPDGDADRISGIKLEFGPISLETIEIPLQLATTEQD